MQTVIAVLVGLMVSAPVVAERLVEGWVRRSSGEPVEAAQVLVFDWTDLQRGAVAQATTDAAGYFALPLKSLGGSVLPQEWTLGQNYPNPFNPSTIIPYQVPTAGRVRLEVFNVLGQRVATLVDGERSAGVHMAAWDATDAAGRPVGAGVYFYRLSSAGQPTLTRRMVLLDGQARQATASVPLPQAQTTAPAAEGVYGLAVMGEGLVTYVDASFGVWSGMAAVEVVVAAVAGLPRGKALTDGVLGDVNGDGQVTLDDALLVTTYVVNGSVEVPPNGDLSLGDVNGDGLVDLADVLLLVRYVANPADGSLPAGIGQAGTSSGGAWVVGAIRRLTDNRGHDFSPTWSPDGRHIAFASDRDGNYGIYVMGSDGSKPRRLTDGGGSPTWSPDGRHIAFHSAREGYNDIYVMGSDGSNPRRLTTDGGVSPTWSPDGRHIAFASNRDGNDNIYVIGLDGSKPRRLTDHSAEDGSPSWSPDGRHLVFMSDRDGNDNIYVIGSDGSKPRRLTHHSDRDWGPTWSPDGRHIAFASDRDGNYGIYVMGSDGSKPRRLTDGGGSPTWSPDGRHIAFVSWRDGNAEICVMELRQGDSSGTPLDDGDSPATATPVVVGESLEGELSAGDSDYFRVTVSSPGTLTASTTGPTDTYGSIEDSSGNVLHENDDGGEGRNFRVSVVVEPGTYYIRVRGFDDSSTGAYTLTIQMEEDMEEGSDGSGGDWVVGAIRNLTDHSASDFAPSWSPDGRRIAFYSNRDGNGEIYVMGSNGSNLRRLINEPDYDHVYPSWSPDGRHIAFMSERDDDDEIYVIGSDGSNLRRLTNDRAWDGLPSWSPDGRHIAFTSSRDFSHEIYVMGSDGSNLRRLTNHSAADGYPSWSPDGRHIAFVSKRDGNEEIYVMGSDGSNPRRLTDHSAADGYPSWSPDGRHIAFASERDGNEEIYVMGSDGSNPRRLTDHSASDFAPSWSPDGRHIAFVSERDGNWEIYVMELRQEGGGGTPLDHGDSPATATTVAVDESIEGELSAGDSDYFRVTVYSPGTLIASTTGSTDTYGSIEDSLGNVLSGGDDGGEGRNFRVSAVVEPDTYYIRVRGFDDSSTGAYTLTLQMEEDSAGSGEDWVAGPIRRLTDHSADDRYPAWSPDGRYIAFTSTRDGNWDIYVMGSDGSNPRRLTNHSAADGFSSWSPDGRHIAFMSYRDGNEEIYVMGSDGSNLRRLINHSASDGGPSWSPDGRHIAFASDRDGNFDIYVMGSDGSNPRRLINHSGRDLSLSWSPYGRHIAFMSNRDGNFDIYVMDSDGRNPRRLTDHSAWDGFPSWSPDGRHIAFESTRDGNADIYVMGSDGSNPRRLTDHSAEDGFPSWSPDGRHIAFVSERDGNGEIYVMELRQEDSE